MQDLVNYVDDIPDMMKTMNRNVSRLHVMEYNSSYDMAYSMRGNVPLDVNDRSNAVQIERMSNHALKAMNNVAKFTSEHNQPKTVQESSNLVIAKLKEMKEKGMDVSRLYAQYDVNRNGKISYKDFNDTLIASSTGLRKDEAQILASELDTKKVGSINYKDMLANLQDISSRLASNDSRKVGSINYRDILTSLQETAPLVSAASPEKRPTRASVTSQALDVVQDHTEDGSHLSLSKPSQSQSEANNNGENNGYLSNYTSMLATARTNNDNDDNASYLSNYERTQPTAAAPTPTISRRSVTSGSNTNGNNNSSSWPRSAPSSPSADSHSLLAYAAHSTSPTSKVAPNITLVPLDIINIQALSPHGGGGGGGTGSRSVCSDISYQDDWPLTSRRMYSSAKYRHTESPYYVEPSPQELKEERKQRAHSAPPRARPLYTMEGENNNGAYVAPSKSFKYSLRSALIKSANADEDGADNDGDADSVRSRVPNKREQLEQQQLMRRHLQTLHSKTTENGIVDQLGGRLNQLRHVLKQQDCSKSGTVNKEEFHTALRKSGVILTKTQVSELYDHLAKASLQAASMGHGDNKALNIESFVNRMQARTIAPAFSHLNAAPAAVNDDDTHSVTSSISRPHAAESIADRAARSEELRIVKKVLHSANKNHNPHGVFHQIDKSHVGWIGVRELKDALDHLDANLSPLEFNVLLNKVDKTGDGKINLSHFEQVLHTTVTENDRRETQQRQQALRDCKFYNATYQTSKELTSYDLPEYDTLAKSPSYRKESLSWDKLKSVFQSNQKNVLAAFVPEVNRGEILIHNKRGKGPDVTATVDIAHVTPLTVAQLERNLEHVGVRLGSEDVNQLRQHLRHRMEQPTHSNVELTREERVGKDATVSLEDFCSLMNIEVNVNHRDTLELKNPRESQADGGIFAASKRSQVANPTLSTSYYMGDNDDVFNEKRRKIPQIQHLHHSDPSRFWEFSQCPEVAVLYPQPMASLREPFPDQRTHPLEKKAAVRGLAVPDTGRAQAELIKSGMVVQENEHVKERRGRSVSAPRNAARSASLPTTDAPTTAPTATTVAAAPVARAVNNSLNVSNTSLDQSMNTSGVFGTRTSEHISKWASSSLADYFDSKTRQQQQRSSNNTHQANPQTLRRIVQQSTFRAPFATDV